MKLSIKSLTEYGGKLLKSSSLRWLLLVAAIALIVLFFGKVLMNAMKRILAIFGLADTEDETRIKLDQAKAGLPGNPWNYDTWKSAPRLSLTVDQGNDIAAKLHKAISKWNVFGDDEQAAIAAIKECKTQADVSFVSWRFHEKYSQDLYNYLYADVWYASTGLNEKEMQIIIDYVNGIPKY